MTSPFISVGELADALSGSTPPAVLDASFVLHPAKEDGDYRTDSGRPRWLEAHIPGSQHVDVSTQFSDPTATLHYTHPEPQAIADELARLGIRHDRAVVIYDSTGNLFAARLWYLLRWIGVPARVLDGGFAAWQTAGERTESGEGEAPEPVPGWQASAVRKAWVSKSELLERDPDDPRPLVCGLPAGSFTGADPTRYSRRGRIPGSVNVSSRDLFSKDGHVKTRVELILAYDAAGIDVAPRSSERAQGSDEEVLLYCGGGISAAANALTLAAIGTSAVRIYDGSLEEWSADQTLPLEVGEPTS
jgi:thiosulfate/3-mercaptopyruvate sulfurtransferase